MQSAVCTYLLDYLIALLVTTSSLHPVVELIFYLLYLDQLLNIEVCFRLSLKLHLTRRALSQRLLCILFSLLFVSAIVSGVVLINCVEPSKDFPILISQIVIIDTKIGNIPKNR